MISLARTGAKGKAIPLGHDGEPMTAWQIWLRRLCQVMFVWASLELVLGIGFLFVAQFVPEELLGGMRVLMNLGVPAVKQAGLLLGTSSLIGAFFNVVIAFLGIRGSENPVRIAPFFWIALIDAVVIAWALASSITQGVIDPVSIVSSLFVIMLAVGAWKVRKQTGYFDRHP